MAYGRAEMPDNYRSNAPSHGLCNCCCCLSLSLLLLVLIAIGIALFFILVLKPAKPEFNLQSASIETFKVEKELLYSSGPAIFLSMNIAVVFSASNPNKVAISYSPTRFTCVYKDVVLGVAKVPPFHQAAHSHNTLTAVIVVDHMNLFQSSSIDLLNDATVNDRVVVVVNGPVEARIKVLGINSPKVEVSVHCPLVIHPQERKVANSNCNVGQVTLSD
eukprot:c10886_g1_i1 orf=780-1433(+)